MERKVAYHRDRPKNYDRYQELEQLRSMRDKYP